MADSGRKPVTELTAEEARAVVLSLRIILEAGDKNAPVPRDYLRSIAYLEDHGTRKLLETVRPK